MGENPGGEEVPLISMLHRLISTVNPAYVSKDIDAEGKPQVVYHVQKSQNDLGKRRGSRPAGSGYSQWWRPSGLL